MLHEKYCKPLKELYDHQNKHSPSYYLSNWGSEATQKANFKKVTTILKQTPYHSLLDVGSGIGSIQKLLNPNTDYTGIDITESIVKIANNPKITHADILKFNPNKTYDAVICIGAFNMAVPFKNIIRALKKMEKLSNQITILTISYFENKEEIETIQKMGYQKLINRTGFDNAGDQYLFFKQKNIN